MGNSNVEINFAKGNQPKFNTVVSAEVNSGSAGNSVNLITTLDWVMV